MPKTARKKVESGIYHIVLRGINKQTIFFDDEDREVFLNRIKIIKEKRRFEIYGFCLMSNHVHMLIKEIESPIGSIFMMMLSSYVLWYNVKYKRIGNLFQDRYRSEGIEDDAHLLCALRYIHQNPIVAGVVENIDGYDWSSHSAYTQGGQSFIDTEFILRMLGGLDEYEKFVSQEETRQFIENNNRITITDDELIDRIRKVMEIKQIYDLQRCERKQMEDVIATIRQTVKGASIRQISRVTGVSVNIIRHIK